MNEIIALQKYENEAQLAKELIRGFWLAHGDYVITDEEAAENLAAWTDKGHVFYFILKEEIPIGFVHLGSRGAEVDWIEDIFVLPGVRFLNNRNPRHPQYRRNRKQHQQMHRIKRIKRILQIQSPFSVIKMHRNHSQKTGDFIQTQQRKHRTPDSDTVHFILSHIIHQHNRQNSHCTVICLQQRGHCTGCHNHQQLANRNLPVRPLPCTGIFLRF